MGVLLAFGVPAPENPLQQRLQLAYGYTGLVGWIVLTITTVAFKLFPIWVWQERFQADFGKRPVPGMKDLYSRRLRDASRALLIAGVLATAVGIAIPARAVLSVSFGLVFAGVVGFVVNFAMMARWALLRIEYRPSEADRARFRQLTDSK